MFWLHYLRVIDYKELSKMSNLPVQDRKVVQNALSSLPPRINAAKEMEMGEMMGKLKEVSQVMTPASMVLV